MHPPNDRKLQPAGIAPGGPLVQEDHVALKLRESNCPALGTGELEIREGSRLLGGGGTRTAGQDDREHEGTHPDREEGRVHRTSEPPAGGNYFPYRPRPPTLPSE